MALAEMNVVPLVDVVLVLLIIFMLTAQVMEFGYEIDVPKVKEQRQGTQDLPIISVSRKGDLYLNEKPLNINEMQQQIRARFPKSEAVYMRADKGVTWDALAQVISAVTRAGFKVAMVTKPDENTP
jgi:biopolymer transport protein ExbD